MDIDFTPNANEVQAKIIERQVPGQTNDDLSLAAR